MKDTKNGRKHIDVHVHCRDWGETNKATIGEVTKLARSQGVVAIGDMPNTKLIEEELLRLPEIRHFSPVTRRTLIQQVREFKGSIVSRELVDLRLKTAEEQGSLDGYYLHIGATKYEGQLVDAAKVATENPRVLGIKDYYGKTTGSLQITERQDQENIFRILTRAGYKGVVTVHCEKEIRGRPELLIPEMPATWNKAKPPAMETEAVMDIIEIAKETRFKGHIHIAHTSTPGAVWQVYNEKCQGMRISCGVTPHHLTLSTDDMQTPEGIKYKVNPPIRERDTLNELIWLLRAAKIDIIETDHAPHLSVEKSYHPSKPSTLYMSGIRSLDSYSNFLNGLISSGLTGEFIHTLTYVNPKKIFSKITE
jgi:dihydroorotase